MRFNKYTFYEKAVQSPETDLELFASFYKEARGREARRLREDFCGTFQLACEWVKADRRNSALALDLDAEPLRHGRRFHQAALATHQRKRLSVLRKNVLSVTDPKSDLIIANNFSFYTLRQRKQLVQYLRCCVRSLAAGGMLVLEMAGGPGMKEKIRERKTVRMMGKPQFKYVWDQKSYDPIHREGHYAIHFILPGGRTMKNQFTYHWRVWTIPEVREAMLEAGFRETVVYWETSYRGEATGEYLRMEKGDNAWSWIAYVASLK